MILDKSWWDQGLESTRVEPKKEWDLKFHSKSDQRNQEAKKVLHGNNVGMAINYNPNNDMERFVH